MRGRDIIILVLVIVVMVLVWLCRPCWTGGSGSCCPPLSIDQKNAVGTFMSLSLSPLDSTLPAEVAPARIRAYRGEEVVWVFRNPGGHPVTMQLARVWDAGSPSGADVKKEIFSDLGGRAKIAPNCGFGTLKAVLRKDIAMRAGGDTCAARALFYDFMVYTETDSFTLKYPYDPELVIEGKP